MTHKPSDGSNAGAEPASARHFDVFISHASRDRAVVDVLRGMLESRGLTCWLAENELRPGENWQERIRAALNDSRIVLLLFTPATGSPGPWLSAEWSAIQENAWRSPHYPVVPVVLGDAELPPFARRWQALRMDAVRSERAEQVADAIAARAKRPESLEATPTERDRLAKHQRFADIVRALQDWKC